MSTRRVPSLEGLWPILLCLPLADSLLHCTYPSQASCYGGSGGMRMERVKGVTQLAASSASIDSWSQDASSGAGRSLRSFGGGRKPEGGKVSWEAELFARLSERRLGDDPSKVGVRSGADAASRRRVEAREEQQAEAEEEDMLASLFKRPHVGPRRLHRRFRVQVKKPLGLFLAENKDGLVISQLVPGGNAEAAGMRVGDRVVATMATMGTKMWSQRTLDGAQAAISSRLAVSDDVTFDVERLLDGNNGEDSISSRAVDVYEVELEKPLPIELMQGGSEGGVYVKRVGPPMGDPQRGDSEALRQIQPYDRVVAVSASLGDQMWRTNSLEGVLSAVNTRIGSTVRLQLERSPETARLLSSMKPSASIAFTQRAPSPRSPGATATGGSSESENANAGTAANANGGSDVLLMHDQRVAYVRSQMAAALRERDPDRAISIYKLAVERGVAMDTYSCTSLIKAYGLKKAVDKALGVLRMMEQLGIPADLTTYNTLLNACDKAGALDLAAELFATELPARRLRPDLFTYSVMVNMYGKRKMLPRAVELFEEMLGKGLKPDLSAYTTMIKAAVQVDDMEAALDYLRRMFDDMLEPDVRLYNTLIWGHCKRREWGKAVRILRLMESKDVAPDLLTYSYLISCHVDCRQFEDAAELYKEMRNRLIRPNVNMYSIAIDLFAKMGDTKGAADAFKEMRAEKIPPNFVTYTSLMEAFLNAGFSSAALSISDETMKSPTLRKDVASYVMRIRCFVELGNLEAVEGSIKDMLSAKIKPNVVVYNEYLRGALRLGRFDLALRIFSTIIENYVPNQQTHAYLLQTPAAEPPGASADALSPASTSTPTSTSTSAALAGFYYDVLRRMERVGPKLKPRVQLYLAFLNACIRADRLDLAEEIVTLRRANRLQIYRLLKKHMEVVDSWEHKVDRLRDQRGRLDDLL